MKVLIEITVDVEDPGALIAVAREQYTRLVTEVDVEGMTEEEALAVADLTTEEKRAHVRYFTPTQAIPEVSAAVTQLVEIALHRAGAQVESATAQVVGSAPGLHGEREGARPEEPHERRRERLDIRRTPARRVRRDHRR